MGGHAALHVARPQKTLWVDDAEAPMNGLLGYEVWGLTAPIQQELPLAAE